MVLIRIIQTKDEEDKLYMILTLVSEKLKAFTLIGAVQIYGVSTHPTPFGSGLQSDSLSYNYMKLGKRIGNFIGKDRFTVG